MFKIKSEIKLKTLLTIVALSGFLDSCSSLNKPPETLKEDVASDDPTNVYKEILKKDPTDEEAKIALMKARETILDKKLIQVRQSRLAGNEQNSIDMLLKVIAEENSWKYYPTGNVEITQEEEIKFASEYVSKKIYKSNLEGYPFASLLTLKAYKPIFEGKYLEKHAFLTEKTKEAGVIECKKLTSYKTEDTPYFETFVNGFCSYWTNEQNGVVCNPDKKHSELFSSLLVEMNLKGISEELLPTFQTEFQNALSQSAWYDPEGKQSSRITLNGIFQREHKSEKIQQIYEYNEKVPYTAYEPQTKYHDVPYQGSKYECQTIHSHTTSNTGEVCGNVPVTEYRKEPYTESLPVTKFRDVLKTMPYEAIKHYQLMVLITKGNIQFGHNERAIELTEKSEITDLEHSINLPNIGLVPKKLGVPDPLVWLKLQASSLGNQFGKNISELWDSTYCKSGDNQSVAAVGDQIHRCLKNHYNEPPQFVESWYQNKLGISVRDAKEILNLKNVQN